MEALAIDPTAPATVYTGGGGGVVFRTTDGGGSLSAINTGLTNTDVDALAIDPTAQATAYAGAYGGGVFVLQKMWRRDDRPRRAMRRRGEQRDRRRGGVRG